MSDHNPINLLSAIRDNNQPAIRHLLRQGVNPFSRFTDIHGQNTTCIKACIEVDNVEVLTLMLNDSFERLLTLKYVHHNDRLCQHCEIMSQVLSIAAMCSSPRCLEHLLGYGLDPTQCLTGIGIYCSSFSNAWYSVLHASKTRLETAANILIQHGALLNIEDVSLEVVLHKYSKIASVDIIARLLKHGANVNSQFRYLTPIMVVCHTFVRTDVEGYVAAARLLIEHGADVNIIVNHYGLRLALVPLHIAIWSNALPLVELLLQKGADPKIHETASKENKIQSCCVVATKLGRTDMVCLLLEWNAQTLPDKIADGSLLYNAVSNYDLDTAKVLYYNDAIPSQEVAAGHIERVILASNTDSEIVLSIPSVARCFGVTESYDRLFNRYYYCNSEARSSLHSSRTTTTTKDQWRQLQLEINSPRSLQNLSRLLIRRLLGRNLPTCDSSLPLPAFLVRQIKHCGVGCGRHHGAPNFDSKHP